ncbi:holo-ACP synthase [Planctomyces sp. SH-PL62]|uniref:holo-ACP synthase n=1 Tax=Planctomyces sp. SH-PL62 TaxID=1636152 RepID=UPI00078EE522|nr:holo-ACP synthase [Planctomyces sp. SH-PL62]AMV39750.1 Holo-[acyl-carrier-protein] synthase [Planctomyces sp. SH-PL62]
MEIIGIGTDIVECPRIGGMIERHGELFLRRIYTDREIRACQARRRPIEHFAARWAAKEAVFKALGTGPSEGVAWTDVEIRGEARGSCRVLVAGAAKDVARRRGVGDVLVSMAHCRTYATAYATAVARPDPTPPAEGPGA